MEKNYKPKIAYRTNEDMKGIVKRLMEKNKDFVYRQIGTATFELQLQYRRIKSKSATGFFPGSHLSRLLILEVEKRLAEGLYKPINDNPNRRRIDTVMFDKENIKNLHHKPMVAIDINGCYWNTAHKLGVISNYLYEKGMAGGNNWKKARNASIGSLNALIKEYHPENGRLVCFNYYCRPYNNVRLDIIDHVWQVANQIAFEVKDGFCMFLTDCFFVTKEYESRVYELLESYGYSGKSENVMFEVFVENRVFEVIWSTKEKLDKRQTFSNRNLVSWRR